MREQRDDRQEVVGSEEELKRRDVKACGREVEVRVEVQRCAPEQDCADVNDQEEREIGAGDRLQPRNEAMPLLPPSDDKRETADDLKRNAAQESELDQWKAVDRPGNLHERNVFGRSRQTDQAAKSVIEAFRQLEANILVQEYIKEASGADLRCFVIDGKVVASMKRQGAEGDFRSNLHRGGKAEKIKLTPEERSTAIRATKAMGLRVAGVDLLRSNHGPVVIEVNSSPGLEGIEAATGVDVAKKIIDFVAKNATLVLNRDRYQY